MRPLDQTRTAPPAQRVLAEAARERVDVRLDLLVPAAIRVGEMLLQLLFLSWLTPVGGPSLVNLLTKWDAAYYGTIAASGYPGDLVVGPGGGLVEGREFAFYPAYPMLAGVPHALGLSTNAALLLTAALCGIVGSVGVHLLARELHGSRRAGWFAAAALGALPMAVTLQMGYAESLYLAVTAFALLAAVRGDWWLAGGLALLAGLTRPAGVLVPLAIPLAAMALARRPGRPVHWPTVATATGLGLLGTPLYWAWLWARTGRADTWFQVEDHGWHSGIDFGRQTWDFLVLTIRHPDQTQFMGVASTVSIVLVVLGCVLAVAGRHSRPLVLVTVLSAAMTLGATNYWHSKPRLLLACFPLVVLAAPMPARLRTSTAVVLTVAAVAASAWFGAYALAIWPYAV